MECLRASLAAILLVTVACLGSREPHGAAQETATRGASSEAAAFLDTLQARTFRWFWDQSDPQTGLTPDRWPTRSFASVSATG